MNSVNNTKIDSKFFDKNLWHETGYWYMPCLPCLFFSTCHLSYPTKEIAFPIKMDTTFVVDGHFFQTKVDEKAFFDLLNDSYSSGNINKINSDLDRIGHESFLSLNKLLDKTDSEICASADDLLKKILDFYSSWVAGAYLGDAIIEVAKLNKLSENEADFFAKVHPHLRETWIETEVKDIILIAKRIENLQPGFDVNSVEEIINKHSDLKSAVQDYIDKYDWCRISKWRGNLVNFDDVIKRIKEEAINIRQKNHIEHPKIKIVESDLDPLVLLSVITSYWRAECGKQEMILVKRLRPILHKIAESLGVGYDEILSLTPNEFIFALKNKFKPNVTIEILNNRAKGLFCTVNDSGEEIIRDQTEDEFKKIKNIFLESNEVKIDTNILRGVGASPGNVTGVVRVVMSAKDFPLFQEGEILVAPETSPTFVPLMRMASAILTGRGGITSHAAIVSRELCKPCIIAVKDIVKILKTGDQIEVDAKKGIIKILS